MAPSDETAPTHDDGTPRLDDIYTALGPRLAVAKRAYVRKRAALFFALPLTLGIGAAFAADAPSQTTEIAGAQEAGMPPPDAAFVDEQPEPISMVVTLGKADKIEAVSDWKSVPLGAFGSVEVGHYNGEVLLGESTLADGWTVKVFSESTDEITLIVSGEGETFAVHVHSTPDGYTADVEPLLLPTPTPEPTPKPEPTKKPAPEVETRKVISVFDIGKVVVERDGNALWIGIKSAADGFTGEVIKNNNTKVEAIFVSDQYEKHVKAWIDGSHIKYDTWYVEVAPAFQTRKELSIYGHGTAVVERIGDSANLVLDLTWIESGFTGDVITAEGPSVEAVLLIEGWEKHVRAWTDGPLIKSETWAVQVAPAAYDGVVSCEFGTMGVIVENGIATITSVTPADGVTATITKESGEFVTVQYDNGAQVWLLKAWGNGSEIVSEAIQIS